MGWAWGSLLTVYSGECWQVFQVDHGDGFPALNGPNRRLDPVEGHLGCELSLSEAPFNRWTWMGI